MPLKRVDLLLHDARVLAHAEDYSDTSGLSDEYLIRQLNNAKLRLQRLITVTQSRPGLAYSEVTISTSVESVAVPTDCFVDNLIYGVEYSGSGSASDYYELKVMYERGDAKERTPQYYMTEGGNIYFDCLVSSGKVRICYEAAFYNLDIRRGQITGMSLASAPYFIELYRGVTGKLDPSDAELALNPDHICCVDRDGEITGLNAPVDYYDQASSRIYLISVPTGHTIAANQYVVIGANTTTHPSGPEVFNDYYSEYVRWEIEKARSSTDAQDESEKLATIAGEIVELYDQLPAGNMLVPIMRRD